MDHVAIDLGGKKSQICVRAADKTILEEKAWPTADLANYLSRRPPSRVLLETSAEAFAVADWALLAGHEVRVVPSTLARTLGVGSHGVKTDRRDARAISEASCMLELPTVHIPSAAAREWRAIATTRDTLVAMRTRLVNTVKSWMRGRVQHAKAFAGGAFAKKIRAAIATIPAHIERLLLATEALNEQIKDADREVGALAKSNEICRRLMTTPGVGPVTALRFVATIDDVKRFRTAHAVQSYLGLTPGENSSSDRVRRTRLTKAGSPQMRWLLVQAAWTVLRTRPSDPMAIWATQVAGRRGKAIAAVALARKLAGVLFALWRDGSTYSSKGTTPTEA
jgi:transposase